MTRYRLLLIVVVALTVVFPRPPSPAQARSAPSLASIALSTRELPHGFHLAQQGRDTTPIHGLLAGQTWTYLRPRRVSSAGLFKIVNTLFRYDNVRDGATGMNFTAARACGSHAGLIGYHGITASIGDYNVACYYPLTVQRVPNVRVIAMALRRFQYVTVIRVYATPPTFEASVEGKVAHWAALVDRRIELAVHPSSPGPGTGSGTPSSGPYLKILACKQRGCIWRAQGRGNTLYRPSFRSMPRSWKFTPPQIFLVDFQFDCGRVTGRSYSFLLYEVDDIGERVTLREYADQRNIGTVAAGLPAGGKRLALQILVQNTSCR